MEKRLTAPFDKAEIKQLRAGDRILITGILYTARDAAHQRMYEACQGGKELPVRIEGITFYYMGSSPAREGRPIGSAGPTRRKDGQIYAGFAGSWNDSNDRQGQAFPGSKGSHCQKRGGLLCRCRRCGCIVVQSDYAIGSCRIS